MLILNWSNQKDGNASCIQQTVTEEANYISGTRSWQGGGTWVISCILTTVFEIFGRYVQNAVGNEHLVF